MKNNLKICRQIIRYIKIILKGITYALAINRKMNQIFILGESRCVGGKVVSTENCGMTQMDVNESWRR